ncbi:MAG: secondary thiamine-phosphate synthase enzyme YjbQ [Candidatus Colwellbacteria bacterium]|nr:secondary thiamine-phosphate synthase enzyme YjbQ [Candidatus Colwellbacteria bacterium]
MKENVLTERICLETKGAYDMIDITHHATKLIADRHLKNGLLNLFVEHTTCALAINEFTDPKLLNDFRKKLSEFSPEDAQYEHNESHVCNGDDCVNGHSHCNALFLPTSITCQIVNGKLNLGTWQRIFLIELDRARPRNVQLMFMGEGN